MLVNDWSRAGWVAGGVLLVNPVWAAGSELLWGLVWWLIIPFIPAILILLLRGWQGLSELRGETDKTRAEALPIISHRSPSAAKPSISKTEITPRLTDTGIYTINPTLNRQPVVRPKATLERWGTGQLSLTNRNPVAFGLGGMERLDLGRELNLPTLAGFVMVLGKGGMRIVSVPEGIEVGSPARLLQPGDKIEFDHPTAIRTANSEGQLNLSGLVGAPSPAAMLNYTGSRPEQHRALFSLYKELELSREIPDSVLRRLRVAPAEGGIKVTHIPSHLSLALLDKQNLEVGQVVKWGETLYLRDTTTRAGLGIIDVGEP